MAVAPIVGSVRPLWWISCGARRRSVEWPGGYAMLDQSTIQQHVDKIESDGYSIIPNAIESDFVEAMIADLGRLERELDIVPAKNRFEGTKTVRIYNLLTYGKLYERIPVHENVLPIVERVLDPGCLVSSLSSIAICGDEKPQPIHADDQLIPLPRPHVPIVCNTMWALTDFTDANGATRIVPGSHQRAGVARLLRQATRACRRRCRRAASWSTTAASGTAAAPTAPGSAASAWR